jgi:hypothetical protein
MPAANGKKRKRGSRSTHGATVSAVARTRAGGKAVSVVAKKKR